MVKKEFSRRRPRRNRPGHAIKKSKGPPTAAHKLFRRVAGTVLCVLPLLSVHQPTIITRSTARSGNCSKTAQPNRNSKDIQESLATIQKIQECASVLGYNGSWVQDWDYAKEYGQYAEPRIYEMATFSKRTMGRFHPSPDAPYRWETSWKWQDHNNLRFWNSTTSINASTTTRQCQIDYTMDADTLCSLLAELEITRVLFWGDSMGIAAFESFINKLNQDDRIKTFPSTFPVPNRPFLSNMLRCKSTHNNSKSYSNILFGASKESGGAKDHYNSSLCAEGYQLLDPFNNATHWYDTLIHNSDTSRYLIVFNIGAHYKSMEKYQLDLHWFKEQVLDRLHQHRNPQRLQQHPNNIHPIIHDDLVFWRPTPSGHIHCEPRSPKYFNWTHGFRMVPLQNYSQFQPTAMHGWDQFDAYNAYAHQLFQFDDQHHHQQQQRVQLLPVVNMTLLRQDGYMGGPDCLHRHTPGPLDWWNHLLFTHLKLQRDLEQEQEKAHSSSSSSSKGIGAAC